MERLSVNIHQRYRCYLNDRIISEIPFLNNVNPKYKVWDSELKLWVENKERYFDPCIYRTYLHVKRHYADNDQYYVEFDPTGQKISVSVMLSYLNAKPREIQLSGNDKNRLLLEKHF